MTKDIETLKALVEAGKYFPDMKELENVGYCKLCYKEPKKMPQYNRGCIEVPYWSNGQWGQGEDAARKILEFITQAANSRQALKSVIEENESMKAENNKLKSALGYHINADSYASTFPDDEQDEASLRKQETWNRFTARTLIDEKLESECVEKMKERHRHEWDKDGERCVKCGDKDWFASPICKPKQALKREDD